MSEVVEYGRKSHDVIEISYSDFQPSSALTNTIQALVIQGNRTLKQIRIKSEVVFAVSSGILLTADIEIKAGTKTLATSLSLLGALSETSFVSVDLCGQLDNTINATLTITTVGATIDTLNAGKILVVLEYFE